MGWLAGRKITCFQRCEKHVLFSWYHLLSSLGYLDLYIHCLIQNKNVPVIPCPNRNSNMLYKVYVYFHPDQRSLGPHSAGPGAAALVLTLQFLLCIQSSPHSLSGLYPDCFSFLLHQKRSIWVLSHRRQALHKMLGYSSLGSHVGCMALTPEWYEMLRSEDQEFSPLSLKLFLGLWTLDTGWIYAERRRENMICLLGGVWIECSCMGWYVFSKHHHSGCELITGLVLNGLCVLFILTSLLLSLLYWDAKLLCTHLHVWLLCPGQPGTTDEPLPVVEALPNHHATGN